MIMNVATYNSANATTFRGGIKIKAPKETFATVEHFLSEKMFEIGGGLIEPKNVAEDGDWDKAGNMIYETVYTYDRKHNGVLKKVYNELKKTFHDKSVKINFWRWI